MSVDPQQAERARVAREKRIGQAQRTNARLRRRNAGPRDMAISLAVLLVPIVLIVWFFQRTPDQPQVSSVDAAAAAQQAQKTASFPVLVAKNLPTGWTPVRAEWAPAGGSLLGQGPVSVDSWIAGYQSPDKHYLSITQQAGNPPHFLTDFTKDATPDGSLTLGGQKWTQLVSADGTNRYLQLVTAKDVALVSGAVSYDELAAFANTLAPA